MRKSGLIFMAALVVIVLGIHFFLTDKLLERRIEVMGSRMNGALVELDGFHLSILDLRVRWSRMQITDPDDTMKNLFETGETDFDVDLMPLFQKKVIIENLQVEGMRSGTDRENDGSLPESMQREKSPFARKIESRLADASSQIPVFNPDLLTKTIDVDGIWASFTPQSPEKIRSLRDELGATLDEWETRLHTLPSRDTLDELQAGVTAIRVQNVDTVKELTADLKSADSLMTRIESNLDSVNDALARYDQDVHEIRGLDERIAGWIEEDYGRALSLAQIPDLSKRHVAEMLFGEQIIARIDKVSRVVGKVREYSEKFRRVVPKKEKPPRLKGQDIPFVREQSLPKFWIKNLSLSGVIQSIGVSGNVTDVVSSQATIDRPTLLDISGTRPDRAALNVSGRLDYRGETPVEELSLGLVELPMRDISLTGFPLLPATVTGGRADLVSRIRFFGDDVEAQVRFTGRGVEFAPVEKTADMSDLTYETARFLSRSIDRIDLDATVRIVDDRLTFDLSSNLDDLIADHLNKLLSGEIDEARRDIERRLHAEVDGLASETTALLKKREGEMRTRIEAVRDRLDDQHQSLEGKRRELEKKLEAEKEKARRSVEKEIEKKTDEGKEEIEKGVGDKIKKLF